MRVASPRRSFRAAFTLAALVLSASSTRAGTIIAPAATQSAEGDLNNLLPFGMEPDSRMQQVYASSDFASMGGPQYINQIAFREDRDGAPFAANIPDVRISLSTTSQAPGGLSTTFANNIGSDASVVYQGNLPIFSMPDNANNGVNPRPFDVVINLQHPFLYDPSKGNLLLDVSSTTAHIVTAWNTSNPILLDATTSSPDSSLVYTYSGLGAFHPGALVDTEHGIANGIGVATQFQTGGPDPLSQPPLPASLPEPSTLAFSGLVALGLLACRRRRERHG